jgi:insulysin
MATVVAPDSTVIRSASDTRSYRYITLANGLKALLIHGDDEDKAAAALDVNIGWLSVISFYVFEF